MSPKETVDDETSQDTSKEPTKMELSFGKNLKKKIEKEIEKAKIKKEFEVKCYEAFLRVDENSHKANAIQKKMLTKIGVSDIGKFKQGNKTKRYLQMEQLKEFNTNRNKMER